MFLQVNRIPISLSFCSVAVPRALPSYRLNPQLLNPASLLPTGPANPPRLWQSIIQWRKLPLRQDAERCLLVLRHVPRAAHLPSRARA